MRILDLFCGAGGCSAGYEEAGLEAVGIDIDPQPNYPYEFGQADALHAMRVLLRGGRIGKHTLADFDAIHASPPCQALTTMSNRWRGAGGIADTHVNLIPETRELLIEAGLPYVIENVPGAKQHLVGPVRIGGGSFGLGVSRARLFEANWPLSAPRGVRVADPVGVYGKAHDGRLLWRRADGSEQRAAASLEQASEAMGIDWMTWRELAEAIPPAYTRWIGEQLVAHLRAHAS